MIVRLNEEDLKRELAHFAARLGGWTIQGVFSVLNDDTDCDSLIELMIDDEPQVEVKS